MCFPFLSSEFHQANRGVIEEALEYSATKNPYFKGLVFQACADCLWLGHGSNESAEKKERGEDMGVYMWVNDEGVQAEAEAGSGNQ